MQLFNKRFFSVFIKANHENTKCKKHETLDIFFVSSIFRAFVIKTSFRFSNDVPKSLPRSHSWAISLFTFGGFFGNGFIYHPQRQIALQGDLSADLIFRDQTLASIQIFDAFNPNFAERRPNG